MQVDWAVIRRGSNRLSVLVETLGWSRLLCRVCHRQSGWETLTEAHENAFLAFGGAPRKAKERTLIGPSRGPPTSAKSSGNSERDQIGELGEIIRARAISPGIRTRSATPARSSPATGHSLRTVFSVGLACLFIRTPRHRDSRGLSVGAYYFAVVRSPIASLPAAPL
jgi:hypothetical protein